MPIYDDDVQDIMKIVPGRIFRVGLSIVFIILLLIIIGLYFFKSPEVVKCPIVLTTINPPLELFAQSTGQIDLLRYSEKEIVHKGDVIAVIKNTAIYSDVLALKKELKQFDSESSLMDSIFQNCHVTKNLILGELQNNFMQFIKILSSFQYYLRHNYVRKQLALVNEKIDEKKLHKSYLEQQQKMNDIYFHYSEIQFKRDSQFYSKHPEAISGVDLEKKNQEFLAEKIRLIDFITTRLSKNEEILDLKETKMNLLILYEKESNNYIIQINEALKLLQEAIRQWENKYVITSSISGSITFTGYWSKNQMIKIGNRLAAIIPIDSMRIIGRAFINMEGIGKVEIGQEVNIKLNGFPYVEFGMLKGVIKNISLIPENEKGYLAEIELTNGMLSSYNEHLQFIHKLEGEAEIITKDQRLIFRLVKPLIKLVI